MRRLRGRLRRRTLRRYSPPLSFPRSPPHEPPHPYGRRRVAAARARYCRARRRATRAHTLRSGSGCRRGARRRSRRSHCPHARVWAVAPTGGGRAWHRAPGRRSVRRGAQRAACSEGASARRRRRPPPPCPHAQRARARTPRRPSNSSHSSTCPGCTFPSTAAGARAGCRRSRRGWIHATRTDARSERASALRGDLRQPSVGGAGGQPLRSGAGARGRRCARGGSNAQRWEGGP